MNDEIRAAVKARLKEKGLSQADLARLTGKHPNAISRTLNGHKEGGKVPDTWQAILDALDLRLTVEAGAAPKDGEEKKPAAPPAGQPAKASAGQGEDLEDWGEV